MGTTWAQGIHASSMDLLRGDLRAWRTHGQWTEETVDRIIDRGHQADWRVLRDAVLRSSAVRAMVIAISQERQYDDYLSHAFTFWLHYAQRAGSISARRFTDSPVPAFVHKQAVETLMPSPQAPDWEYVASAAARLQTSAPGAAVVGGTAAALHAGHRTSTDADPILTDLESHFDRVLARLEAEVGWMPARTVAPKLILEHLDGVDTGIRQLMRTEPLETTRIQYMGHEITMPTYAETLRIKGILILKRNQQRDYLDFAALAHGLSLEDLCAAMKSFDRLYPQTTVILPCSNSSCSWVIPARPRATAKMGNGLTYACLDGPIGIRYARTAWKPPRCFGRASCLQPRPPKAACHRYP